MSCNGEFSGGIKAATIYLSLFVQKKRFSSLNQTIESLSFFTNLTPFFYTVFNVYDYSATCAFCPSILKTPKRMENFAVPV